MVEPKQPAKPEVEPDLAREMAAIPDEPLLPVEKKLIAGSLLLGVILLGVLYWLSQFFPTGPDLR
jgi:hypothetical protein